MKHKKRSPTNPLLVNDSEYCIIDNKKKRKYRSREDAELFAPAKNLNQYKCPYCGYWHNGSSKSKVKDNH